MSNEAATLNWGDIIRIHGVNLSKSNQDKTKGLIVSKGFTDPNIYYQKYDKFEKVNLYRQSLFQILPRSNFDMHDQLMQPNLTQHQKQQLKSRAASEINAFQTIIKAKAGKQITYGSQVIFRHVQSQHYLRGILKAADIGEGAFKIQVTQNLCSQLVFRITSHRSYQHQNDKIYYDDALQIYHPGADCFMNFSDADVPIYLDRDDHELGIKPIYQEHPFYSFFVQRPSIKKPEDKRIPVVNENKSKCLWKFIQHCTYEQYNNKNKIKSHDIVYFVHTKDKGLVSSTLAKPIQSYLKQKGEGLYYECFWQLIPKQVNQLAPEQCNSFWVKNVITGQFLTYEGFCIQIQPENPEGEVNQLVNQGLINLVCSDQNSQGQTMKLQRGQTLHLPQNIPVIIQKYQSKFQKVSFVPVPKMAKDIFKIFKVDEKTLLDLQYALSSHEPLVKLIQVLASGLIKEDYEKQSFNYSEFFKNLDEDNLNNIVKILKMLIGKIYDKPYQQILSSGTLPNQNMQKILVETGIVQLVIQIINLLYQPFLYIELQRQPIDYRAIRYRLSQIFQFSYRLLEKAAVNNEDNRMYISRWVDLFLKHSNNINQSYIQECLVGILQNNQESILATIDRKKINELIESFFKEAKVPADTFLTTKYLRLFSTFIVCQNRVIKQNQNIILNDFFKTSKNQQVFKVKLQFKSDFIEDPKDPYNKLRSRQVLIAFGKQQFTTISKFFRDWTSKWNYFMSYVNLLADTCMDRNNEAIKNVSAFLTLQMIVTILFDPQLDKLNKQIYQANEQSLKKGQLKFPVTNVHEPFIRIAHYLYINNDKFSPVKRIKRISRWYRNQQTQGPIIEDVNRTKRVFQGQKQEEEKKYLEGILFYIKQYLTKASQENYELSMLYTILNILKTTIILGLWRSISQFRQLIPLIAMRITKIDRQKLFAFKQENNRNTPTEIVLINKKLLQMNRPEINKSIECKIIATQIFRQMNQFQIDIRLRYIMNFFKGLYQTTEDFNIYDIPIVDPRIQGANKQDKQRQQEAKKQFFKVEGKAILGESVKKVSEDQQIILKTNVWLSKLKQMTPFTYEPNNDKVSDRYLFQGGVFSNLQGRSNQQVKQAIQTHFQNIVLALLQLPVYHNQRLLGSGLKMLRSIFEQRKQLMQNFQTILICNKGNLQQLYLTLKFMRNKFQMLTNLNIQYYENNEDPNFSYALWKPYDSLVKTQQKRSGIIQDLYFLSRTLKDNISLKNIQSLMRVQNQAFDPKQVNSFTDERQKNNVLFQALNIAQGIYIPLMEYVKIMSSKQIYRDSIHFKLLRSIFQYLTQVCYNNLEAKQLMVQYVPDVLKFMSRRVGAAQFVYVICYNNKTLISNQQLIQDIIESSLQACIYHDVQNMYTLILNQYGKQQLQISKDYEKSQIFYALRGICLFNQSGHHKNQQLLMNRLQDNKFRKLIYQQIVQFKGKIDNFDISTDQSYVAAHFEMFSSLVESGNMINIGKLENIHPYAYCLECLKLTNRWQIRRALRSYINRLYYVNKQKDIFLFQEFIRKQFDIINNQLNDIVQLHKNKSLNADLTIKNGIRFKYVISQIMLEILEILFTLHQILLKTEFKKILKRELIKEQKYAETSRPLHEKLIRLYRNIGCLNKLYHETKTIRSFIREIQILMRQILENMQTKYIEKKTNPQGETEKLQIDEIGGQTQKKSYVYDYSKSFFRNLTNMIRDIRAKQKLQKMREQFKRKQSVSQGNQTDKQVKQRSLFNIFSVPNQKLKPVHAKRQRNQPLYLNSHLQTTSSRAFKVLAKPQISQNQQNFELNNRLGMVKKMMDESPFFRKFKQEEHLYFVKILSKIDQTSRNYYAADWEKVGQKSMPVISMKQMIKITFDLIMKNSIYINDEQKIFIIKLIRCYITEAVEQKQNYKLSIDKWEAQYSQEEVEGEDGPQKSINAEFVRRQNLVQECGGSQFLIYILSQEISNKVQLLNEALLLGIAYLFGGNQTCQNSILKSLRNDKQNIMLLNVKKLIKKIGDFLIQIRSNKDNDKKRSFAYNIVDTFDYFSMDEYALIKHFNHNSKDRLEMQIQIHNQLAMCRIFRFLQLFCENNNVNMKRFLSTQTNEDESRKTNSVNFIDQACLLLRKIFKIMNTKVVNIPNFLLAFIAQITQLPCLQNQIALIKSTFFQDISYLASFFEESSNKKLRSFNDQINNDDKKQQGKQEQDDNPMSKLLQIYQQGVTLALSNFEGNDPIIMIQFLNKCHPRYLWIVMRNNIWNQLNEAQDLQFGIIDKQAQDKTQVIRRTLQKFSPQLIDQLIQSYSKVGSTFRQSILMILNIITIMKKIQDFLSSYQFTSEDEAVKEIAENFRRKFEQASEWEYIKQFLFKYEQLLLSIEVTTFNGNLNTNQNIYFPKHPVFNFLSGQTRNYIMMQVKRETHRDKLIELTKFEENIFNQIKWNYDLNYNVFHLGKIQKKFPITSEYCEKVHHYAWILSMITFTLMIIFMYVDYDTDQMISEFGYGNLFTKILIKGLSTIQFALTMLYFYLWTRMRSKLALQKYHKKKEEDEGILLQPYQQAKQQKSIQGWVGIVQGIINLKNKTVYLFQRIIQYITTSRLWQATVEPLLAMHFTQSGFDSMFLFVLGSVLGYFYGIQWFALHIFDYFAGIALLANVFKAIMMNIKVLAMFSMLAGAFILVFNIVSFRIYTPVIYDTDLPQQSCQTIMDCVLQLYTSGAIGDDMDTIKYGRLIFDTIYVVFMQLLFQNLVGGIMIDAFTQLKQQDNQRDDDKKQNCYICSMTVSNMEKNGETFKRHIQRHFLWNYIYYIYCLKQKNETDYTGIEYQIRKQLKEEDTSWFPSSETQQGQEVKDVIDEIKEKLKAIKQRSQELINKSNKALAMGSSSLKKPQIIAA